MGKAKVFTAGKRLGRAIMRIRLKRKLYKRAFNKMISDNEHMTFQEVDWLFKYGKYSKG